MEVVASSFQYRRLLPRHGLLVKGVDCSIGRAVAERLIGICRRVRLQEIVRSEDRTIGYREKNGPSGSVESQTEPFFFSRCVPQFRDDITQGLITSSSTLYRPNRNFPRVEFSANKLRKFHSCRPPASEAVHCGGTAQASKYEKTGLSKPQRRFNLRNKFRSSQAVATGS